LLHLYYCNLLQLQVTEKSNLLPVTSLLVTSYYPTLTISVDVTADRRRLQELRLVVKCKVSVRYRGTVP